MKKIFLTTITVIIFSLTSCKKNENLNKTLSVEKTSLEVAAPDKTNVIEDSSCSHIKKEKDGSVLISGNNAAPNENIIISKEDSNINNAKYFSTLFKNNIKGSVHKITEYQYWLESKLTYTYIYIYNYDGNIVYFERKQNNQSPYSIKESYTYDKSKKLIKLTSWMNEDKDKEVTYIYNKNKLMHKITTIFPIYGDNVSKDKTNYIYDALGNIIEENEENRNGSISNQLVYKYNNKNQKIEEKCSDAINGFRSKETFDKYNSNGDVTNSTFYENKFDKGISKTKVKHNYEYDENNNWIKQTYIVKEKITTIEKREIEYF
jgi:hypothetical protein